ncbi:MAG: ABC transporter ATP-binding protein [Clostridiales bacterium]|nr:ABC transporter ATP-binding protein [Clostridiales bacterium]
MKRAPMKKGTFKRLIKMLFISYKPMLLTIFICLFISALASSLSGLFLNSIYEALEYGLNGTFTISEAWAQVLKTIITLGVIYLLGMICSLIYNQVGAILTQKFLRDIRVRMFEKMQKLPIKYFDSNANGDIMSMYTNDTDALRQLISQSIPQLMATIITVITLSVVMIYLSLTLFIAVVVGLISILLVTKTIGGRSAKYFIAQQKSVGKMEGFVEEMINGQKVVKVFCHEEEAKNDFEKINGELCEVSNKANAFSNMLMPIIHNIGNILYVLIAFIGGAIFIISKGTGVNISFANLFTSGTFVGVLELHIVITFLGLARRFANTTGQISNQINSVIMAIAGAGRIFELLDEPIEQDEGYVTLVNVIEDENGNLIETDKRTNLWAWKHPHKADGTVTYTKLMGDITMDRVDFGYNDDNIVLHDVSLYAKPGQKIAFVGATGAGKTTITNLLNRFYDIADGKIRYDNININKIKKDSLRRSLGIVLQDTNLFTDTVMNNIRYGRLNATDEECIEAAKLVGADSFITRLPNGYNTMLEGDGSNLSQGQRQLLSIARAAVSNAPVMIMDEATSSIDTRTEALVQKGTDSLMKGRTVFVIAHRLSTIQNADVIMVLDKGRIIERGNHEELIQKKGTYYQLYTGAFELD